MPRPTIKEIATLANVHPMTVSRVLRGQGRISQPTRERILTIAKKLGYVPNAAARAMVSGKFFAIALIQSIILERSILPWSLFQSILLTSQNRGYKLLVFPLSDEHLSNLTPMSFCQEISSDGLVINYNAAIPDPLYQLIQQLPIPAIWVNSKHSINCVYPDDFQIGYEATRQLLSLGHQRIVYVNHTGTLHYSAQDRLDGYLSAMKESGNTPEYILLPDTKLYEIFELWNTILHRPNRPTAAVGYTAKEGWIIYKMVKDHGLRIPQDFSIIVVHDEPPVHVDTVLSTMIIQESKIGETAVDLLLQQINNQVTSLPPVAIPGQYHPGMSTAPLT